jgi:hypothetical protein
MAQKNRKKVNKFHLLKCWMFSFESCSLDVFFINLGIIKLQYFYVKKINSSVFFPNFLSSKPWIRIWIYLECWIRIADSINPDPQHCFKLPCLLGSFVLVFNKRFNLCGVDIFQEKSLSVYDFSANFRQFRITGNMNHLIDILWMPKFFVVFLCVR